MGVVKFTPDMNATNTSTDVSVLNRRSGSLTNDYAPGYSVFDNKEAEDIDRLKSKMKLKLGSPLDVSDAKDKPLSPRLCDNAVNGHELSISLPNLNETDIISLRTNCNNEKNVRSSLSDIYDGKLSPTSVICSPNSSVNSTSCLLSKSQEPRSESSECSPNEKQALLRQQGDSVHQNSMKSTGMKTGDVTITMDGSGNRLSAVLENIPLFYLPQTKQLISLSPEHKKVSMETPDSGDLPNTPVENSAQRPASSNQEQCSTSNELSALGTNSDNVYGNHAEENVTTSPPTNCKPLAAEANACHPEGQLQTRNRRLSSEAESECSTIGLSQDSDASSSCRTVLNHSQILSQSQGKSDNRSLKSSDFDEISLSRVSLERDSPKNTLHRANTIGSLPLGDGSSYSSISSISTGTDFSLSAASYTDDFIEIRSGLPEGDEREFMEVNLNSRNSFERSRNSSMDSGIDEKQCHQGAKPKRRGLSGFFTR